MGYHSRCSRPPMRGLKFRLSFGSALPRLHPSQNFLSKVQLLITTHCFCHSDRTLFLSLESAVHISDRPKANKLSMSSVLRDVQVRATKMYAAFLHYVFLNRLSFISISLTTLPVALLSSLYFLPPWNLQRRLSSLRRLLCRPCRPLPLDDRL